MRSTALEEALVARVGWRHAACDAHQRLLACRAPRRQPSRESSLDAIVHKSSAEPRPPTDTCHLTFARNSRARKPARPEPRARILYTGTQLKGLTGCVFHQLSKSLDMHPLETLAVSATLAPRRHVHPSHTVLTISLSWVGQCSDTVTQAR